MSFVHCNVFTYMYECIGSVNKDIAFEAVNLCFSSTTELAHKISCVAPFQTVNIIFNNCLL